MNLQQKKSFSGFLFAFIALIALGYSVLVWVGLREDAIAPVDNMAQPA
jgi:hypothetical protein